MPAPFAILAAVAVPTLGYLLTRMPWGREFRRQREERLPPGPAQPPNGDAAAREEERFHAWFPRFRSGPVTHEQLVALREEHARNAAAAAAAHAEAIEQARIRAAAEANAAAAAERAKADREQAEARGAELQRQATADAAAAAAAVEVATIAAAAEKAAQDAQAAAAEAKRAAEAKQNAQEAAAAEAIGLEAARLEKVQREAKAAAETEAARLKAQADAKGAEVAAATAAAETARQAEAKARSEAEAEARAKAQEEERARLAAAAAAAEARKALAAEERAKAQEAVDVQGRAAAEALLSYLMKAGANFGSRAVPSQPVLDFQKVSNRLAAMLKAIDLPVPVGCVVPLLEDGNLGPKTQAAGQCYGVEFPARRETVEPAPPEPPPQPPKPDPMPTPVDIPPGYDPGVARTLAGQIETHLRQRIAEHGNKARWHYDRNMMRRFQAAAGISPDGLYGGQSRGALIFYGAARAPGAFFDPKETILYVQPGTPA